MSHDAKDIGPLVSVEGREGEAAHQAHALLRPHALPVAAIDDGGTRLAITGGKGGVGKTLLAVNLSLLAQRSGFRVLLVDFDPGLGNVDVHMRLSPRVTLEDIGLGRSTPSEAVLHGPRDDRGRLDLVLGRSGSTRMFRSRVFERAHEGIESLRANYDLVVFDTGAGIGPNVLGTLGRADASLLVTTPEPAAVTDAYALCKVAHGEGLRMPSLVMNRVTTREDGMRTASKLGAICERFLHVRPDFAGLVRDDEALGRAALEQVPLARRPDRLGATPALDDLRALTATVLSRVARRKDPSPRPNGSADLRRQRDARRLLTAAHRRAAT